jgi:hypothetical protein
MMSLEPLELRAITTLQGGINAPPVWSGKALAENISANRESAAASSVES